MLGKGYDGVRNGKAEGVYTPFSVLVDSVDAVSKPVGRGLAKAASRDGEIVSSCIGETRDRPCDADGIVDSFARSLSSRCFVSFSLC